MAPATVPAAKKDAFGLKARAADRCTSFKDTILGRACCPETADQLDARPADALPARVAATTQILGTLRLCYEFCSSVHWQRRSLNAAGHTVA